MIQLSKHFHFHCIFNFRDFTHITGVMALAINWVYYSLVPRLHSTVWHGNTGEWSLGRRQVKALVCNLLPFCSSSAIIDKLPSETVFSEDESREYFKDLLLGLEYCESAP